MVVRYTRRQVEPASSSGSSRGAAGISIPVGGGVAYPVEVRGEIRSREGERGRDIGREREGGRK